MSFNIINLTPLQNGKNGKVPCIWTFYNKDNDNITIENYFKKDCGLKNGDQIIVISSNYTSRNNYYVSVNKTTNIITVIANN